MAAGSSLEISPKLPFTRWARADDDLSYPFGEIENFSGPEAFSAPTRPLDRSYPTSH
jgi:hypothetical protein